MKKILVAVDGSDNSERALMRAKSYAECVGSEITILTVEENLGRIAGYGLAPVEEKFKDRSHFVLDNSLKLLNDFKGKIETKVKKGNPADEIIKEAEDVDYDLIIMGSKGLGTFTRTILGSVSNKVLNHTKSDVLIVK